MTKVTALRRHARLPAPEVAGGLLMYTSRKELRGTRVYTAPLFGIIVLLACYWVLSDWPRVPTLIASALDAVHLLN